MDIYRMISERGGEMKLVGLQDRVETMANMVGITSLIEVFPEAENALRRFRNEAACSMRGCRRTKPN